MTLDVRTVAAGEMDRWVEQMYRGFLNPLPPGAADRLAEEADPDRTWAAFDGDAVVATLRSFATPLTVPGPAEVTAAALTNVTVAATHRRRGLLRRMITADLAAAAERGEPVGILIASEYPIYGRFGYGAAVERATYEIDAGALRLAPPFAASAAVPAGAGGGTTGATADPPDEAGEDGGSITFVDPAALRAVAPAVYDRYRRAQPGAIGRDERWWDRVLHVADAPGAEPWHGYQVVRRDATGEPDGYLRYTARQKWEQMRPDSTITVVELVAPEPAAYRALWSYCCAVDLVTRVEAPDRSVAEALPWMLHDARAVLLTGRNDFVWVRVLDPVVALSARAYEATGSFVVEVVDPLGFAAGRYRLDAGPEGADCRRTDAAADLTMPVDALGAVYLGGTSLALLATAGRVDEHRAGAVAGAEGLFRTAQPPWCSTWF